MVIRLQRDGGTITVAWSQAPRPATVQIPAGRGNALLVDKYGGQTPITPRDGAYQLALDPATANTINGEPNRYYIGGNPQLLVEDPSFPLTN